MCRGGGEVTVACSAQHFAVLLLACYPWIVNEVLRNGRSRSFFWSVLQVDCHCLPVQVDIRALCREKNGREVRYATEVLA